MMVMLPYLPITSNKEAYDKEVGENR